MKNEFQKIILKIFTRKCVVLSPVMALHMCNVCKIYKDLWSVIRLHTSVIELTELMYSYSKHRFFFSFFTEQHVCDWIRRGTRRITNKTFWIFQTTLQRFILCSLLHHPLCEGIPVPQPSLFSPCPSESDKFKAVRGLDVCKLCSILYLKNL
jgi:hypothetical protein